MKSFAPVEVWAFSSYIRRGFKGHSGAWVRSRTTTKEKERETHEEKKNGNRQRGNIKLSPQNIKTAKRSIIINKNRSRKKLWRQPLIWLTPTKNHSRKDKGETKRLLPATRLPTHFRVQGMGGKEAPGYRKSQSM